MAICLDEFQQISEFDGGSVENAIRNQVQQQREMGYVFAGSQPSLMQEMLSSKRPFHKTGPQMFLDKIPALAWKEFITSQFRRRGRSIDEGAMSSLLEAADLIPYDVRHSALRPKALPQALPKLPEGSLGGGIGPSVCRRNAASLGTASRWRQIFETDRKIEIFQSWGRSGVLDAFP